METKLKLSWSSLVLLNLWDSSFTLTPALVNIDLSQFPSTHPFFRVLVLYSFKSSLQQQNQLNTLNNPILRPLVPFDTFIFICDIWLSSVHPTCFVIVFSSLYQYTTHHSTLQPLPPFTSMHTFSWYFCFRPFQQFTHYHTFSRVTRTKAVVVAERRVKCAWVSVCPHTQVGAHWEQIEFANKLTFHPRGQGHFWTRIHDNYDAIPPHSTHSLIAASERWGWPESRCPPLPRPCSRTVDDRPRHRRCCRHCCSCYCRTGDPVSAHGSTRPSADVESDCHRSTGSGVQLCPSGCSTSRRLLTAGSTP